MFRHWCNTMLEMHVNVLPWVSCNGDHADTVSMSACCAAKSDAEVCSAPESNAGDCCDESLVWLADDSERFAAELPVWKDLETDLVPLHTTWTYSLRQNQIFRDLDIFFLRPPPPFTHSRTFQSVYLC